MRKCGRKTTKKTKKKPRGTARRPPSHRDPPSPLFSLPRAVHLLLDVLQPRPDPLQLGLVLVKVHRRGRRERAERERLRGDAGVDYLEVCGNRLRPLVGEDSRDGRGPEGPWKERTFFFFVRVAGGEKGEGGERVSEGRRKGRGDGSGWGVSDSPWSTTAKQEAMSLSGEH